MNLEDELKIRKFRTPYHKVGANIMYTANWLYGLLSAALKPYGISEQQYRVLKILQVKKGVPVNLQYLNDRMIYRMSNTTRLVEKLRQSEYLERFPCEYNRRMVEISITDEGLELLKFLDPLIDAQVRSSINKLSKPEMDTLSSLLEKLWA